MKFLDIIQQKIEIPLIQRDYVQGLDEQKAEDFLEAIKKGMSSGLNLDFIYGNKRDDIFIPIDGQQRITTLFLLYYYLSLESRYIVELENFSYAIRPTSKDFIEKLTNKKNWEKLKKNNIKKQITDSNWYFLSWESDLTIKSILNMLHLIEKKFKDSDIDNLSRIEFEFLDLDRYQLGEDLYIKMNARGKQLSSFENFKAEFEKFIQDPRIKAKIDNEWLDIFWKLDYKKTDLYFYNFFYNVSLNFYLEKYQLQKNFLKEKHLLDFYKDVYPEYIDNVVLILDNLENYSDLEKFTKIREEAQYYDRLYFYIWSLGILKGLSKIEFQRWDRVCRNLISNIRVEDSEIFTNILREILKLSSTIDKDVYRDIDFTQIEKFSTIQIKEEVLKIDLISKNPNFEREIIKAEKHWYLDGQIGFLLKYSNNDFDKFIEYRDKFLNLFNDKVQKDKSLQTTIQRALLSIDEYILNHKNSNKYTFCSFDTRLRVKNENWRRVFNKSCFKELLDKFNSFNDLKVMIDNYPLQNGWRSYFINPKEKWSVLEGTKNYQIIKLNGSEIYLNSGETSAEQWGWKRKKELYSFFFYKKFQTRLELKYYSSSSEYPCAYLDIANTFYYIDIFFDNDKFQLRVCNDGSSKLSNNLINYLISKKFKPIASHLREDGYWNDEFTLVEQYKLADFLEDLVENINKLV